jgi:hypothetical protein
MTVTPLIDGKLSSSSPKSRERGLSSIETENFHSRDRDVTDRTLTCKYYKFRYIRRIICLAISSGVSGSNRFP